MVDDSVSAAGKKRKRRTFTPEFKAEVAQMATVDEQVNVTRRRVASELVAHDLREGIEALALMRRAA